MSIILEQIETFLRQELYPTLNEMDDSISLMKEKFTCYRKQNFFKIHFPSILGGADLSLQEQVKFQEIMGRFGGAFAFLQVQMRLASWFLQNGICKPFCKELISQVISGEIAVGNATSYMLDKDNSMVTIKEQGDTVSLNGIVPFFSGWDMFDYAIIGARNDIGEEYFLLLPLRVPQIASKALTPMAMNSMNTVRLDINNLALEKRNVLAKWDNSEFSAMYHAAPPLFYPLGIAIEALDQMERTKAIKNPKILKIHEHHTQSLTTLRNKISGLSELTKNNPLMAEIISVTWKIAQFSMLASGGSGMMLSSTVQRLYRELLVWYLPKSNADVISHWATLAESNMGMLSI